MVVGACWGFFFSSSLEWAGTVGLVGGDWYGLMVGVVLLLVLFLCHRVLWIEGGWRGGRYTRAVQRKLTMCDWICLCFLDL